MATPEAVPDEPNFEGRSGRDCGEHRTVGPVRAWCHDCTEWCYPTLPCRGCEAPRVRVSAERVRAYLETRAAMPQLDPREVAGAASRVSNYEPVSLLTSDLWILVASALGIQEGNNHE